MHMDADNAEAERGLKLRAMDLDEREKEAGRQIDEVTAISEAVAQVQGLLDALSMRVEQAHQVASAPRRVTIERGPDGRAIGARQVLEGAE